MDLLRGCPLAQARALERSVQRHNDVAAMIHLGELLLSHRSFAGQRARGLQMLERAIKQAQHPRAMHALATYLLDRGGAQERVRAVALLERSLQLEESAFAANKLGECYCLGDGVAKNPARAIQLFERALRQDQHPAIMVNLAINLLESREFHGQTRRAIALFKRAIHLSSDAQFMNLLALSYHYGTANLSVCFKRASKWYRRAIRKAKLPNSMYNLATLYLDNEPSGEHVQQALRLLEQAMEQQQGSDEKTVLKLANTYLEHLIDPSRALDLYEMAALRFGSQMAKIKLVEAWVQDVGGVRLAPARVFQFCWNDFFENKNFDSLETIAELMWSGAKQVPMDRKKGIELLYSHRQGSTKHCSFSLLLRHDLSCYPRGKVRARRLLNSFNDRIDRSQVTWAEAIILSESECENDKLLAMQSFKENHDDIWVTWLAPYLRVGRYKIPFDGHPDFVTNPVRRFSLWEYVDLLNLASLLLEIEGKQQEAVTVLVDLMNTDVRLIATLNLAYVLMNGVGEVPQDHARAMQLLENAVDETNDISARVMLANALSERADSDECDVERGWHLWRKVEEEEEDKEELRRVRRLVSTSSEEKWRALACQRQEDIVDKCS